jgi:hypothetical protein
MRQILPKQPPGTDFTGNRVESIRSEPGKRESEVKLIRSATPLAIAHKVLVAIWHMFTNGTFYLDLGAGFLDRIDRTRNARHLVRRLANMGFDVQLTEKAA